MMLDDVGMMLGRCWMMLDDVGIMFRMMLDDVG